jgi:hypothetical protein
LLRPRPFKSRVLLSSGPGRASQPNNHRLVVSTDPTAQSMHSSPFNVAGMSASTGAHHNHGPTAWSGTTSGGPLSTSLSDTLSQSLSRTQYQPGYLMVSTICISFLLPSSHRWSSPRPRTMSYSFSRDHYSMVTLYLSAGYPKTTT